MTKQHKSIQKEISVKSEKNHLYPIFLKLEDLNVLLVGGGKVAHEKLRSILSNSPDTRISIVAKAISNDIVEFIKPYSYCSVAIRPFEESDLELCQIIFLTTDDPALHERIKKLAAPKNIFVNTADTPELCDFYLSSIVQKGQLKIAISSNGQSPTIAKRMRELLTESIPDELNESIENLNHIRQKLKGDFEYKTRKLNEITKVFLSQKDETAAKKWRHLATYSLIVFGIMLVGYFLFSMVPWKEWSDKSLFIINDLGTSFYIMVLAGFLAQLVDGALGMGYGVTSAIVLLSSGTSPAAISASIHTAEMFASGASGYSHYKFGNVNMKLFKTLVIPGVIGAIFGAILLVFFGNTNASWLRPIMATYTMFLGIKFLINAFKPLVEKKKFKYYRTLAATGGFLDSFGGGGWGPIVTSTLINQGRTMKYVIGSVSLTEFFVTMASAFTFFTLLGVSHWQTILGLILGGLIAAPIAAKLTGKIPKKISFILLGAIVIIWSLRILLKAF